MAPLLYQVITSPPCRAVLMLARAIGLTIDLQNVNLMTQEHLKPEFLKAPLRSKRMKVVPANLKAEVRDAYQFAEAFLEGNKWICGDSVILADIHFVATISSLQVFEPLTADYPKTKTWLKNCSKEDW
ncbi:glutathione s transferase d10 isoform a-related [Holotrichia oblita]|uniref:Glutathione s transferase d10 isoform a-related n=1 Tax=Holotrichia oblita TaxID=644536 RepID=A0ACB9TUH2_HOLOL|nr:glutathione s transferase d10 isoform a-related [Holotrichia oblita]